jgi:ribosomal protein S1
MCEAPGGHDPRLERQWNILEEHYRQHKPIVARLLGLTDHTMFVDIEGIRGSIDHFVYGFTRQVPVEKEPSVARSKEEEEAALLQVVQQSWNDLTGKEILLRIVALDRARNYLQLSQKLHVAVTATAEQFTIGHVYTGMIIALNSAFVTVDLDGIQGRLPAKKSTPDQQGFLDLSTVLRSGQEIKVRVVGIQDNVRSHCPLILSVEDV